MRVNLGEVEMRFASAQKLQTT